MKGILNLKRWLMASVASFAAISLVEFVTHGMLLRPLYRETSAMWRNSPELYPLMHLGSFIWNLVFAFIYTKGYEERRPGAGQGLRYGLLIGLLMSIPYLSVWYVVLPVPGVLAWGWVASQLTACVFGGLLVGLIYRP